uniref:Zinc finger protein 276 n=1 Tax=Gasterosteus aculeatus aculeatus TaxID=481459 RepID=G3NBN8_GASAC
MKKKSRRAKPSAATGQPGGTRPAGGVGEDEGAPGLRGRPRRSVPDTTDGLYRDSTAAGADKSDNPRTPPESKSRAPAGRLSTALCRLCHGKFSPRSLRRAFDKWPQDAVESDAAARSPLLFHADFQRLVGVQLDRDPRLSEFICKKCHSKFYKCHGILLRFLQRVNLPPVGKENLQSWKKCPEASMHRAATSKQKRCRLLFASTNHKLTDGVTVLLPAPQSITSDPECLRRLVSWAHHHGEACRCCPNLREVLQERCRGSVRAVWGCVDGHSYAMGARTLAADLCAGGISEQDGEEAQPSGDGSTGAEARRGPPALPAQTQSSAAAADCTDDTEDAGSQQGAFPVPAQLEDPAADSDASDRFDFEGDFEEGRRGELSYDEMFDPYADKRARRVTAPSKRRRSPKALAEPKVKKRPGPKPGWKNKLKPKGEELPNIYKCPYQGCTAVYRAPDGLKKHIKEHHEEVKERPCPHPGCNKVFMIDRYLQRHVKLIHTEERNYICDQCGQTFKQRKHLSVHQMRHSGAKPLQCEVCGFQCRQRASLKYHMTKHKAEADLEFACLMCGKRFEKAHNLNVHMSMVHPLIQAKVQRSSQQQQQQAPPPPPPSYSDLHAMALSGEAVRQDHDR